MRCDATREREAGGDAGGGAGGKKLVAWKRKDRAQEAAWKLGSDLRDEQHKQLERLKDEETKIRQHTLAYKPGAAYGFGAPSRPSPSLRALGAECASTPRPSGCAAASCAHTRRGEKRTRE